jgi:hypothetical protein
MKKKRTKTIFETPEARAAWEKKYMENLRSLEARVEKIKAEMAARGTPYKPAHLE